MSVRFDRVFGILTDEVEKTSEGMAKNGPSLEGYGYLSECLSSLALMAAAERVAQALEGRRKEDVDEGQE